MYVSVELLAACEVWPVLLDDSAECGRRRA
jgi:hypothetical protein